jgi:Family of unknown function (DUF5682)
MGAWHLRRFLDQKRPELVLIEGLADAADLIPQITRKGTRPPIAILAYTDSLPVRTLVYPLAKYSPEYQAMRWADKHDAAVDFIDLPSDIFLALQDIEAELLARRRKEAAEKREGSKPGGTEPPSESDDAVLQPPERPLSVYEQCAIRAGEADYETYWERNFEHNQGDDAYRLAAFELGQALREIEPDTLRWRAENLVREAYMRRRIEEAIAAGHAPEKIVAVVGAFHAPVLSGDFPPMTDEELASLRRRASKLTLMPYSYFRLSSQSGYGAGNRAPSYFELLWDSLEQGDLAQLPAHYLSLVTRNQREAGTHRSTAEVIEGVRLANTLSALKDGLAPTLADLRDSAVTLIGHGELATVKEAIVRVEVGTAIGELPEGVSRTSIQADFDREIARLKLEKYKTTVQQLLSLDLRENRQAKSAEAAFLDLNRSTFFHRLRVLGVCFVTAQRTAQQSATWAEKWLLQWTPESEIQLIEAVLLGETVELATGYKFSTALDGCVSIAQAGELVGDACLCGLMKAMEVARKRLQELSTSTSDLTAIAHAAHVLGQVIRYRDVRKFDPAPLMPLVEELFVQGALALHSAAGCDNEMAVKMLVAIDEMNQVSLEHSDHVDEPMWIESLHRLSDADDRNPLLSGYACAILLERGLIANEDLTREVSRRLSPGVPSDLGAGWFEGLSKRNRYALLARQVLWAQLADYISALDEDHFRRSLVFLRRAFGNFSAREKRHIAENLAEHWGVSADMASEAIEQELTKEEEQKLTDLNDFSFDGL